ncbi:MAG: hypothetical protein ACK4GN_13235 [Runella sp.]
MTALQQRLGELHKQLAVATITAAELRAERTRIERSWFRFFYDYRAKLHTLELHARHLDDYADTLRQRIINLRRYETPQQEDHCSCRSDSYCRRDRHKENT